MNNTDLIQWLGTFYMSASAIATALIQFIPTPKEITWKPYVIFYNTVQRLSVIRPTWDRAGNGNGTKSN